MSDDSSQSTRVNERRAEIVVEYDADERSLSDLIVEVPVFEHAEIVAVEKSRPPFRGGDARAGSDQEGSR